MLSVVGPMSSQESAASAPSPLEAELIAKLKKLVQMKRTRLQVRQRHPVQGGHTAMICPAAPLRPLHSWASSW